MRSRLLPLLLVLASVFSCGGGSKSGGGGSPIIYDFKPGRANVNPGTSTLLLANFVGGVGVIDQGIGPVQSGVPVPVSPAATTTYTLTVKGESGDPATAATTISVGVTSMTLSPSAVSVVTGQTQAFTAAVVGLPDTRVTWTATGGAIDSKGLFTAGSVPGAYVISAQSLGDPTLCAKAFVTVLPSPLAISIAVNPPATSVTTGQAITLTAQISPASANGSVFWSTTGGSITQGGVFTAPSTPGPVTVTATSQIDPTKSASTTFDIVPPPLVPAITTPAYVTAGQPGYTASVPLQAGATYAWSITGGVIQGSATGSTLTFTPASSGTVQLSCVATNAAGTASGTGTAASAIVAPPTQPVITFPTRVTANQAGYTASIPPQPIAFPAAATPGSTYAWTISGGTIQGSATGTSISFTPGGSGTVQLSCVVTNAAGTPSPAGSATCTIVAAPIQPIITAPAALTLGLAGYTASIPAQAGSTYAWTITNGSIQGSATGTSISFTAGTSGSATGLSCVVTNAAGTASTPGTASCPLVAAPTAGLAASTASPLRSATNVTITPTFTGGTAVVGTSQGASNISTSAASGTPIAVQATGFTTATTYWVRVTNAAGTFVDASTTITPQTVAVGAVSPATPTRTVSTSTTFSATVTGGALGTVSWSASAGTWSGATWTAPATAGSVTVTATSVDDPTKSASTTVTVVAAPTAALGASSTTPLRGATNVTITPTFTGGTAIVGTSQGASNISTSATSGSPIAVQATGFITATNYWVRVTNAAGTFVDASTTITPQTVVVGAVSPATPTRTVSTSTTFSATVTGGALGTVTWTSSAGTWSGATWTAPATAGPVTVTATSVDDPTKSASTTVTVVAAPTAALGASSTTPLYGATNVTVTPTFSGGTAVVGTSQGASNISTSASSGTPIAVQTTGFTTATTYWVRVTNAAGTFVDASTTITPQTVVVGAVSPATPTRTVSTSTTFSATVTGGALGTVTWTSSAGTWSGATWTAPATPGSVTITATSVDDPTKSASTTVTVVAAPTTPVVTAPTFVTANQAGYTASIPAQTGSTYAWSITGGSITAGATTTAVTFTPGASGSVQLSCVVTNLAGTASNPGTATSTIVAAPATPLVTAPAFVTASQAGYAASVPAQAGSTYAWSITGGSITAGAGTTSVTFTAGASGSVQLSCVVTNQAGTASTPGSATSAIVAAPTAALASSTATPLYGATNVTVTPTFTGGTAVVGTSQGASNISGSAASGTAIAVQATGFTTATTYWVRVTNAAGTFADASTSITPQTVAVGAVSPATPTRTVSTSTTFSATVTGGAVGTVTWTSSAGTWSGATWTAPATAGSVTVTATSVDDPTKSSTTTVTVVAAPNATSLVASTTSPLYGATVTLTPTFSNGTATIGTTGAGSSDITASATSGTAVTTAALTTAHTYTLTVTNAAGTSATTATTVTPQTVAVAKGSGTANATVSLGYAFSATVTGALNTNVNWTASGGAFSPTTTASGATTTWTAPATPGSYTVTATSAADGTTSQTWTVNVVAAPVATSLVASTTSPLYGATVTLTPTFSNGTATIGTAGAGSSDITASATSGTVVTTAALTTAHTYTLTVTNAAGTSATTAVTVTPQTVVVSAVTPAGTYVTTGYTQAFSATVSGAVNTTVNWSVDGTPGGSATSGTITSAGVYTGGTTTGSHTVTATAAADGTTSQSVTVIVYAAPTITSFTTSACSVIVGASATLTPTFANGTGVIGTTGAGSSDITASATSGTPVTPAAYTSPATFTYTLTVTNPIGTSVSQAVTVHVQGFKADGTLNTAREQAAATLLADGRVLVAGGDNLASTGLAQTEVYDPATGLFTNNAVLPNGRTRATATLLPDGTVLVAGGISGASVFSADTVLSTASSGSVLAAPSASGHARVGHTATLLPNGEVLLVGGYTDYMFTTLTNQEELYIPSNLAAPNNTVVTTTNLTTPRAYHSAVLLPDGRVLVIGGVDGTGAVLASTELFNPYTLTWSAGPSLNTARKAATATLLKDGRVLVTGGNNGTADLASAEILDAGITGFTPISAPMLAARSSHQATLLASGQVLLTGGASPTSVAEVFDPTSLTFLATGAQIESRFNAPAVLLPNGRILLIGGQNPGAAAPVYSQTSEAFYPGSCATNVLIAPLAQKWWVGSSVPYVGVVDSPSGSTAVTWSTSAGTAPAGAIALGSGNGVTWTTPAASGTSNLIATASDGTTGSLTITSGPVILTASLASTTLGTSTGYNYTHRYATVVGALDTTVDWSTTEPGGASDFINIIDFGDAFEATAKTRGTYTVTATSHASPDVSKSINPVYVIDPPTISGFTLTQDASLNWWLTPTFAIDPLGTLDTTTVPNYPYIYGPLYSGGLLYSGSQVVSGTPIALGSTPLDGYHLQVSDNAGQIVTQDVALPTYTFGLNPTTATVNVGGTVNLNTVESGVSTTYGANWTSSGGTLSAYSGTSTTFTAPGAAGTYTVTATSLLDGSKTATCTITVNPTVFLPGPAGQVVSGAATYVVPHAVAGLPDPTVTWSIAPTGGANQATINATTGVVTVPASPQTGTYTITATIANPSYNTISANTTINVQSSSASPGTYGAFGPAPSGMTPRWGHCLVTLPDGRVLIMGGSTTQTADPSITTVEVYDPVAGTITTNGSLYMARSRFTATLLPTGKVLVAGGYYAISPGNLVPTALCEIYDPATGTSSYPSLPYLNHARARHTALLLPNGKVLIAGGDGTGGATPTALNTMELFDPYTYNVGSFSVVGGATPVTLSTPRMRHSMTLLLDGSVLLAGGGTDATDGTLTSSADLFTPSLTDSSTGTVTAVGPLGSVLGDASAVLYGNGQVVLAGGITGSTPAPSQQIQTYDPTSKTFTVLAPQISSAASLVMGVPGANGQAVFIGGLNGAGSLLYPWGTFNLSIPSYVGGSTLLTPRADGLNGRAVLLVNGNIFVGGYDTVGTATPVTAEILSFIP